MNISLDEIIQMISEQVGNFLERYGVVNMLVPLVLLVVAAYYFARALHGFRKRNIHNGVFQIYCCALVVLCGITVYAREFSPRGISDWLSVPAYAAFLILPGILCLHIWSQVSYKKIDAQTLVIYFAIPAVLTIIDIYSAAAGLPAVTPWNFLEFSPISYSHILLFIYWLIVIIKSYLLCFNVLYQMPKHMRPSTLLLLIALSASFVDLFFCAIWDAQSEYLIYFIAQLFIINRCFKGFFRANASNVISTSREFVFSNLSTQVLILSLKGRILEWNKTKDGIFSFLRPKYLQSFDDYIKQLLELGHGVISPHQENIITVNFDDVEYHLLITDTPIKEGERQFGTLIEISEVTKIYSVLRYMETIATIDQMTKLYNKNAYLSKAESMMSAEFMPLLIILGDVNNLKQVNDLVGHLTGDRMLTTISSVVTVHAPENAFIARIGGDEIVLLIPNAKEQDADIFIAKVGASLSEISDPEFGMPSVSWGWSLMTSLAEDYNAHFQNADELMYLRKKAYKGNHPFTLSGTLPKQGGRKASRTREKAPPETAPELAPADENTVAPEPAPAKLPVPDAKDAAPEATAALAPAEEKLATPEPETVPAPAAPTRPAKGKEPTVWEQLFADIPNKPDSEKTEVQ